MGHRKPAQRRRGLPHRRDGRAHWAWGRRRARAEACEVDTPAPNEWRPLALDSEWGPPMVPPIPRAQRSCSLRLAPPEGGGGVAGGGGG